MHLVITTNDTRNFNLDYGPLENHDVKLIVLVPETQTLATFHFQEGRAPQLLDTRRSLSQEREILQMIMHPINETDLPGTWIEFILSETREHAAKPRTVVPEGLVYYIKRGHSSDPDWGGSDISPIFFEAGTLVPLEFEKETLEILQEGESVEELCWSTPEGADYGYKTYGIYRHTNLGGRHESKYFENDETRKKTRESLQRLQQ